MRQEIVCATIIGGSFSQNPLTPMRVRKCGCNTFRVLIDSKEGVLAECKACKTLHTITKDYEEPKGGGIRGLRL